MRRRRCRRRCATRLTGFLLLGHLDVWIPNFPEYFFPNFPDFFLIFNQISDFLLAFLIFNQNFSSGQLILSKVHGELFRILIIFSNIFQFFQRIQIWVRICVTSIFRIYVNVLSHQFKIFANANIMLMNSFASIFLLFCGYKVKNPMVRFQTEFSFTLWMATKDADYIMHCCIAYYVQLVAQ